MEIQLVPKYPARAFVALTLTYTECNENVNPVRSYGVSVGGQPFVPLFAHCNLNWVK